MSDKVNFRRGLESDLPSQGEIEAGSFYVVTDKKRFLYGENKDNLIEFGAMPFHIDSEPPDDKRIFWIDTTPEIGGLKYHNKTEWVHVPVAFTAKIPPSTENGSISAEQPAEDAFTAYGTYTSANSPWTAPYDGWFKIEVYGASGAGGRPSLPMQWYENGEGKPLYGISSGGSGGNGGYSCSIVQMKKGDSITITGGKSGEKISVEINSSISNYSGIIGIESGSNGGDGESEQGLKNGIASNDVPPILTVGSAGTGGTVIEEGNIRTVNGENGKAGNTNYKAPEKDQTVQPAISPTPEKGLIGGSSGYLLKLEYQSRLPGQSGMVVISTEKIID